MPTSVPPQARKSSALYSMPPSIVVAFATSVLGTFLTSLAEPIDSPMAVALVTGPSQTTSSSSLVYGVYVFFLFTVFTSEVMFLSFTENSRPSPPSSFSSVSSS